MSGMMIGIASLTLTILAPIVGYFVSLTPTCTYSLVKLIIQCWVWLFYSSSVTVVNTAYLFYQLPKLGVKFSIITGLAVVGCTYVALGYVVDKSFAYVTMCVLYAL